MKNEYFQNAYQSNNQSETKLNGENKKRFSYSREQQNNQQSKQNKDNIASTSKYTNLKEEKAKISKILEEFEKKQKLEKDLKLHSENEFLFKSTHQNKQVDHEQIKYIKELIQNKPWLKHLPLKNSKLEYLQNNYIIDMELLQLQGKDLEDFQNELQFIQNEVAPKKNLLREKKNDLELLLDARYFNKYGEFLYKKVKLKNFYQRLEVDKSVTKNELKKQYFKLAMIWHPDNIKKKYRYCFANEIQYTKLVVEIYQLFEEAYRTLINDEARKIYDNQKFQ